MYVPKYCKALEDGGEIIYKAQNYIGVLIKLNHVGTYIFGPKRGLGDCQISVSKFLS